MARNIDQERASLKESQRRPLTGRLLARNALWNFIGLAAPLLVALVTIPLLIKGMGRERFGLLGIIWMGIGYFSLFDMGLARALTKLIAERLGRNQTEDLHELVWTGLWLILGFGILGMIFGILASEPLAAHLLNVPLQLQGEGIVSFRLLAASVPIVIITAALIGTLEAHQRFATIAVVRVPLGVMTFLGPLITLQFTPSLVGATSIMLFTRVIIFVVYYACAAQVFPPLKHPSRVVPTHIWPLLNFGGWITVSNIVGPLMGYIDRFFVGAFLNLTAVAYYITPYDMLSRLQVLPQAILGVFFPAMTATIEGERTRLPLLYKRMGWVMFLLMLPVTAGAVLFAPEILQLWLGDQFRMAATGVVRWLALGWMISFIGNRAFMILQSAGRPDITGKVHLVLLFPYLVALWFLTKRFGIEGTSVAWVMQKFAQTTILNVFVRRELADLRADARWDIQVAAGVSVVFLLAWVIEPLAIRVVFFVVVLGACVALSFPIIEAWRKARITS